MAEETDEIEISKEDAQRYSDALAKIESEVAALDFKAHSASAKGSARVGPFKIEFSASESSVVVKVKLKLGPLDETVASGTLTPRKASLGGRADAELVKASIAVRARFHPLHQRRLEVDSKVCHRKISRGRWKWKCKTTTSVRVASW